MNKNKELEKNTIIISIGKISTQFISFLLLPLYTALLSTQEYGTVDLVTTYVQLLLPIILLQIDQALLRYLIDSRGNNELAKKHVSTTYAFYLFQLFISAFIYFIISNILDNNYAIYLYITLIVTGLSNIALQTARGIGDNTSYSVASFICGVTTVVLNVLFIAVLKMKAEGMLLAGIIGNLSAFIFIFIKDNLLKYMSVKDIDLQTLKKMVRYAIPLVPNALIWWIVNASDRSIVLFFIGASANGVLAVAHKFPTLITTVYNIFHISWTESAALHLKEKDKNIFFSEIFDIVYRIFTAASICLINIMPFVFKYVINIQYEEAYNQIPIYTLASFFNVIIGLYSVIYISEMKTTEIAKTSLYSGIINIVIDLGLIKYVGLFAASISSAVAFGVMAFYRAVDIRKYIKQKINYKVAISSFVMIILSFVSYYISYNVIAYIMLIMSLIYSVVINKKILRKILTGMKILH